MPTIYIAAPYWVPDRAAIARNIEPAGRTSAPWASSRSPPHENGPHVAGPFEGRQRVLAVCHYRADGALRRGGPRARLLIVLAQ